MGEKADEVKSNKIVIHGNYANDEYADEQKHIEMHILYENMLIHTQKSIHISYTKYCFR